MKPYLQGLALTALLPLVALLSSQWTLAELGPPARSGNATHFSSLASRPAVAPLDDDDEGDDEDDSGGSGSFVAAASVDLGGGCGLPAPPVLQVDASTIGMPAIFDFDSTYPASMFFLALSPGPVTPVSVSVPAFGTCILHVDLAQFVLLTSTTDSTGGFRFSFTFPNDASLVGTQLTLQAMVWSAGSDHYSNGVELTIGGPTSSSGEEDDDEDDS